MPCSKSSRLFSSGRSPSSSSRTICSSASSDASKLFVLVSLFFIGLNAFDPRVEHALREPHAHRIADRDRRAVSQELSALLLRNCIPTLQNRKRRECIERRRCQAEPRPRFFHTEGYGGVAVVSSRLKARPRVPQTSVQPFRREFEGNAFGASLSVAHCLAHEDLQAMRGMRGFSLCNPQTSTHFIEDLREGLLLHAITRTADPEAHEAREISS